MKMDEEGEEVKNKIVIGQIVVVMDIDLVFGKGYCNCQKFVVCNVLVFGLERSYDVFVVF